MPPTSCSTSVKTRSASPASPHPYPRPPSQSTTLPPRPPMKRTETLPVSAWRRTDFCPSTSHHFLLSPCIIFLSQIQERFLFGLILFCGNLNLCLSSVRKREAGATLSGWCTSITGWECRVGFLLNVKLMETG